MKLVKNNMGKKLAIAGHSTRGNEVIELLEMLGGINDREYIGTNTWKDEYYFLDNGYIRAYDWCDGIKFTLEGFWMKYPFKIGDKVVYMDDNDILVISKIKWDDTVGDIFYNVKGIDEDDCFWCPPELLKPYKETNMNKKLAIRGHSTRGKEVIEILEMMGGKNNCDCPGDNLGLCYLIDDEFDICAHYFGYDDYEDGELNIFTLEEFLEKYPFKVGDKVFLYDNITEGCVTGMKWDEETVKYCVYTSAECWCDVKELLKWNAIDLVEKHYGEQCEEMMKDITLKHLYELGMENIKDEFKKEAATRMDIEDASFILNHMILPNKVNDELEYKFPDGYEFDKVENGKIILKPIKPKYPKTYVECKEMLDENMYYGFSVLMTLQNLIICRDAYWKIAGEKMGLGKPWDSTYGCGEWGYWIGYNINENKIYLQDSRILVNHTLVFPTEEMRDTFYENFKELIESCKELL